MDRNERGHFVPGHAGMGGRPRGSRNKLDGVTDEELAKMIAYCRNALGLPEGDDSEADAAAH
jgi:hypothetical protein